jgi:DNA-binding GntR family transcriptional regulator
MFDATDWPPPDGEIEIAALIFECRLTVEAAVRSAASLRQITSPAELNAVAVALPAVLEQTAEALEALHRAILRMQRQQRCRRSDPCLAAGLGDIEEIGEEIGEAISAAALGAGETVREEDLARRLGKDRSAVRDAAIWLEGRGVVERIGGLGIRAAQFSPADLDDIFEIREMLEPTACAQAALVMDAEEKTALAAWIEDDAEDDDAFAAPAAIPARRHEDFYRRIIQGSKNASLIELLCDKLHYRLGFHRSLFRMSPEHATLTRAEQKRIVAALMDGDAPRSASEMRHHLANARARTIWVGRSERPGNVACLEAWRRSRQPAAQEGDRS